ncbi:NADPH-dependent F420 reductase [Pseudonocardia sp. GCM10023141]|uniref:NADPH-dependent F420 reductase n=1 Tax=Pseudonocardia sp. GCM10023141 TaxID=3252653 RepID=UPI00361E8BBC
MKIAIIGSGKIGTTLTGLWAPRGHDIWIANSRTPSSMDHLDGGWSAVHPSTVFDAVHNGDVVVLAIPFGQYPTLDPLLVDNKIVIDAMNYVRERDGRVAEIEEGVSTSSELVQRRFRTSVVVKSVNSIFWEHLRDRGVESGDPRRLALPMAGNDSGAKATVAVLLDDAGFDHVDAGLLREGQRFQRGTPPYVQLYRRSELENALQW